MEATIGYKANRITTSKSLTAAFLNAEVRIYGELGKYADAQLKGEREFRLSGWYRDARGLHLQLNGRTGRIVFDVLEETKTGIAKFDDQEAAKAARKD